MTPSTPLSPADLLAVLDRALASERGVSLRRDTPGAAVNFRQRLNKARVADRRKSLKLYPEDDIRHGVSAYDELVFEVVGELVYIRKGVMPVLEEL